MHFVLKNVIVTNAVNKKIYIFMGENMEKITGKPSIDNPWLKYYDEEVLNKKLPEKTIYEYILQKIIKNIQIELP